MPHWLENILESPLALSITGAVALLVLVWYLATKQPKAFKAFDTAGGEVKVTRKAVRDLVMRCCEDLDDVGAARVFIKLKNEELNVRVRLRVMRSSNLKAISGYLREQIAQALTENLGVEGIGEIEILVTGILEESKPVEG